MTSPKAQFQRNSSIPGFELFHLCSDSRIIRFQLPQDSQFLSYEPHGVSEPSARRYVFPSGYNVEGQGKSGIGVHAWEICA